jgi:hypothetical protein
MMWHCNGNGTLEINLNKFGPRDTGFIMLAVIRWLLTGHLFAYVACSARASWSRCGAVGPVILDYTSATHKWNTKTSLQYI